MLIAAGLLVSLAPWSDYAQTPEIAEAEEEARPSKPEEPAQTPPLPKAREREDFWAHFQSAVVIAARDEPDKKKAARILSYGEKLIELNSSNSKFACLAANRLVVRFYLLGRFTDSLRLADLALSLPETFPGNHKNAWYHKSLCYEKLGDFQAAEKASEQALRSDGPGVLKNSLRKKVERQKISRAAQLLRSADGTKAERVAAETILASAIETPELFEGPEIPEGVYNGYRSQLMYMLVKEMKKTGRGDEARVLAKDFIESNPCAAWPPTIARHICEFEGSDFISSKIDWEKYSKELERWIVFFEEQGCGESAAIANLRFSLRNAYTHIADGLKRGSEEQKEMYQKALVLGEKLMKFKKAKDDPVPQWGRGKVMADTTEYLKE